MDAAPEDPPVKLPAAPGGHGYARPSLRTRTGPLASSTPMPKDKMAAIESQIIRPEAAHSVSGCRSDASDLPRTHTHMQALMHTLAHTHTCRHACTH